MIMAKKIKKNTRFVKRDMFPIPSIFDFSKDQTDFVKKAKKKRPTNLSKWTNDDFLRYVKEKSNDSAVRSSAYDKSQLIRLRDYLTSNYELVKKDDIISDNELLKKFLDWWVSAYESYFKEKNIKISSDSFCREKPVREFFKTSAWIVKKDADVMRVAIKKIKPRKMSYYNLYTAGGLGKLIYEAGIVDSCYFLKKEMSKSDAQITREIRKSLMTTHEATFSFIVEKTFKKAPYSQAKEFNVKNMIEPVLKKRKANEFLSLNFNSLFENEQS